jgi:hypothetical protein
MTRHDLIKRCDFLESPRCQATVQLMAAGALALITGCDDAGSGGSGSRIGTHAEVV